jgi:uncharacterized protein YfaT (DUF1175 family)
MGGAIVSDLFSQGDAFFDAHADCAGMVRYAVWLPRERPEASVTLTCEGCSARLTIPCDRREAQGVVAAMTKAHGIPITISDDPGGID